MTKEEKDSSIERIKEFIKYHVCITPKMKNEVEVIKEAINALECVDQYKWERDIAVGQLKELGISLGQKIDGVYISKEAYNKFLENK